MKVTIEPAATDESLLMRIAHAFVKQLRGGKRLGAFDGKIKTIMLPLQSHNLEWSEKDKKYLPKIKGERENERQKKD